MTKSEIRYHVIDRWKTVASAYPRATCGKWGIITRTQPAGLYPMQDWRAFYFAPNPIDLTVVHEGRLCWFTDEPRQLYALAEIGLFRAHGNVVVGGLGLGLIHQFLRANPMVESVLTIERASELEELVWPFVDCGELMIGDFYEVLPSLAEGGRSVQTIITDFLFGYQTEKLWARLEEQRRFCREHFPEAQFLEHGCQHRMDREVATTGRRDPLFEETVGTTTVVRASKVPSWKPSGDNNG